MSNLQGINHTHIHTLYLTKEEKKRKKERPTDDRIDKDLAKKKKKIDYQSVDNDFPFISTCSYFFIDFKFTVTFYYQMAKLNSIITGFLR